MSTEQPVPLASQLGEHLARAILAGEFEPGCRLDEVALGERLGVSRNTLREAFRVLEHDQLVKHEPHRGVFVRRIEQAEARELFAVRRQLELGALDEVMVAVASGDATDPARLAALGSSVGRAEAAREADDWSTVGTENALFHLGIVELQGNAVASRLMQGVVALTRLRYLTLGNPRWIHEDFVDENRRIADLLAAGRTARARTALELYLLRAEERLA